MKYGIKYTSGDPVMSIARFKTGVISLGFEEITKSKYDELRKKKGDDAYGVYDGTSFIPETQSSKETRESSFNTAKMDAQSKLKKQDRKALLKLLDDQGITITKAEDVTLLADISIDDTGLDIPLTVAKTKNKNANP